MWLITIVVFVLSGFHLIFGLISVCVGVTSSIKAEVWLAHSVSPIWSGGFFIITGILGITCAKKKTAYLIMCHTAFNVVSVVTAVVSIQLLRLGLVNQTTDGHTYQKRHKDVMILIALTTAGCECLVCLLSMVASFRLARVNRKLADDHRRDQTFYVRVVGDKDILVVSRRIGAPPGDEKREKVLGVTAL